VRVGVFLYRRDCGLFDTLHRMPAHTAARIQQLCTEALAAKTQADVERILPELRLALEEHIKLAKDSLGSQVKTFAALDAISCQSRLLD
jgi:hypothetical protein